MKRSRGRGRRQQNPVNRSYDSNGPDVRVRGTASQVYDKYQALARDAMSAGDRVMAENYLQHAEHYYRIVLSHQPPQTEQAPAADGEEAVAASAETDENGATPLVLSRGNEEGEQEASEKPSRRRGPLRRRRNGEADNAQSEEAKSAEVKSANQTEAGGAGEAGAEAESENVKSLELDKPADQEGEAQLDVAVEAGTGDTVGDVSAAANE
ncbi:MAG: DUF4167 domain-containing protein [Parvibaculales bacterium]